MITKLIVKKVLGLGSLLLAAALFGTGCAGTKPLPKAYIDSKHNLTVSVVKIPEKPQMMDSGQGGILGAIITATSRNSMMKEMLAGVQGETVKELIRQEVSRVFQEKFSIVDTGDDLKLDIEVGTYGFFVPTTVAGIKTGAYQFQITGRVMVFDAKNNSKRVALGGAVAQAPLGSKPTKEAVPEAISQCVQKFAEQVMASLINEKCK